MKQISLDKRTLGVNFTGYNEAEVRLWAPLADKVELVLIKGHEKIGLHKENFGYWKAVTNELKPGDAYKFVIDGSKELPDPASLYQPHGVHEASVAIELKDFYWKDNGWKNIELEEYILYELHTGTFTPEGTFEGIEKKLDYLKSLGINAIEIMPVAQFPGVRNWGYDGVYPFAVQSSYGGAKGLQQLVNSCHQKEIAVVLDVVYNHMGPEGNYLGAYGPYFTEKYKTPWGGAINFDDSWCDGVRNYFIENALMWFRDFHIDALRLDAVHAIKDFSPVHILQEIKGQVDKLMETTGRRHYLITELDLNDTRFINPIAKGGYGMDAQWTDEFHHALRVTAGGETTGYYSDFDGIGHLAKAYRDAYVYNGQFSPHRKKFFGTRAEENDGKQFIVFSQNHDQVGNRMLGERTGQLVSFEMQKLLAGAVLVSPYLPMLFMGEEWSEPNPFLYFVSHTDPQLAEAVRKGRKEEFAAFHAEGEAPDPMAEETFENSKLQWHLLTEGNHQTLFRYYQALIQLRKSHPVLRTLNRKTLRAEENTETQTLVLHRWQDEKHLLIFMNFSATEQSILYTHSGMEWNLLFDSANPKWGGSKASSQKIDQTNKSLSVTVPAESILIYTNSHA